MILTAQQVAGWWQDEGGPASRDVEWVAISMGESSFDDTVVSPAGAIGLWQIMPFHAAEYGFQVSGLYDPQVNAYIAVRLSGYGTNCAAWDTCYLDINASGRYSFLGFPEQGSAAWNNIPAVAAMLGKNPNYSATGGMPPVSGQDLDRAAARWQDLAGHQLPGLGRTLLRQRARLDRLYVG